MNADDMAISVIQGFRKFQEGEISEWTFFLMIKGSISLSYESGKNDAYKEITSFCNDKANQE